MAATITLQCDTPQPDGVVYQAYALRVRVTAATEVSHKIFVYRRGALPPRGGVLIDTFECIADPVDLEDYPEDAPDLASGCPFYRTDNIALLFRSAILLEETWAAIQEDVTGLLTALNRGVTDAPLTRTVTITGEAT